VIQPPPVDPRWQPPPPQRSPWRWWHIVLIVLGVLVLLVVLGVVVLFGLVYLACSKH
jgi:hypothetical protein